MPPLPLATLLGTILGGLSRPGRAFVNVLACYNGRPPGAETVAAILGLRTRFQLARLLRREGLPPFEELGAWVRVIYWVHEFQTKGRSLYDLAHRAGLDPATAYRLVRHTTGRRWSVVCRSGLADVLTWLRGRCGLSALRQPASGAGEVRLPPPPPSRASAKFRGGPSDACRPRGHPAGCLTARLALSGYPYDVSLATASSAWVTRPHAAVVSCIELDPPRLAGEIAVGCVPTRLAFDPGRRHAYVTNQFTEDISIIDVAQRRQVGSVQVGGHPLGVTVARDAQTLYATNNLDQVCALRLPDYRLVARRAIPQACGNLLLHPGGGRLYVSTWKTGLVLELDPTTLELVRRFDVGGDVQDLAISRLANALYVANEDGWIDVVDLDRGETRRVPLPSAAFGLALTPDESELYVGQNVAGGVVVLRRRDLMMVRVLQTGGRPQRIAFTPAGDMGLIANEAGWVDVVR